MTDTGILEKITLLILNSAEGKRLKKAVFSKPRDSLSQKTAVTPKNIGQKTVLQSECFRTDNKAIHRNIELTRDSLSSALAELVEGHAQINIITVAGECEYKRSKSGKETLIGYEKLIRALGNATETVEPSKNNREKNYILSGNEPFLKYLGICDENGRIHDKKRPKFRQINRFLEHIRDCLKHLPEDRIRICDLCCGKSYLSFAVYHYFANILGREVSMVGVDLKSDVVEYCNKVADALGFDGLEFICGDITAFETEDKPELVISLHACDTATDIVLEKAVDFGADVILSTPCCHHELNHTLNCPTLSFIAEHSMLRQKFCDAATDALRLKLLEANGYATSALELIDPDDTPKNIMLRAIKKKTFDYKSKNAEKAMNEYKASRAFLLGE